MPPVAKEDELSLGLLLAGRFLLVRRLGLGGLGHVWLAEDRQLDGELVACKVLKDEFTHDRRAVADLKREVLLTRRLRHPHILAVYTFWETDANRFITMEYVDGKNLADALFDRQTPFTLQETAPGIQRLGDALDYAHGEGVLHRDIKPGNILLDGKGKVRLADFGIARLAREVRTRLTGEISCGTLLYVSPEQLMGEPLDRRSDLYSLAATLYELLSGAPPFTSGSIVTQIQMKPPAPVPHLSDAVNRVLLQGLAKDPDRRQDTCGHFCRELLEAASSPQPAPPPRSRTSRKPSSPSTMRPYSWARKTRRPCACASASYSWKRA